MRIDIAKQRKWINNKDGTWYKPIGIWKQLYREYTCKNCKELFIADREQKYCSNSCKSQNQPKGPKSPLWKGGEKKKNERRKLWSKRNHIAGYIEVWNGKRWVGEHRLIMEKHLKRPLKTSEWVHHINHVPNDNRLKNLMILTKSQHNSIHKSEEVKYRKRNKSGQFK